MHIVITGPSGSGKSTIIHQISSNLNIPFSVSYTTRNKRSKEVDGVDYHFISVNEFKELICKNKLEEFTMFNNNYYGTPKLEDRIMIFDVEYEGVKYFNNIKDKCLFIYIDIDKEIMKERLLKRGSDLVDINKRIKKYEIFEKMKNEIKFDLILDNSGDIKNSVENFEIFLKNKLV
ncbi:guanylate kinase (GUK1) [Vairimorpha necatrix]|uniref:Guanylate kinase (GUK1) n=1 Tax=Vairimorpha necatrix TaxID=6039 RepID=A0AAX4JA33_9MICR